MDANLRYSPLPYHDHTTVQPRPKPIHTNTTFRQVSYIQPLPSHAFFPRFPSLFPICFVSLGFALSQEKPGLVLIKSEISNSSSLSFPLLQLPSPPSSFPIVSIPASFCLARRFGSCAFSRSLSQVFSSRRFVLSFLEVFSNIPLGEFVSSVSLVFPYAKKASFIIHPKIPSPATTHDCSTPSPISIDSRSQAHCDPEWVALDPLSVARLYHRVGALETRSSFSLTGTASRRPTPPLAHRLPSFHRRRFGRNLDYRVKLVARPGWMRETILVGPLWWMVAIASTMGATGRRKRPHAGPSCTITTNRFPLICLAHWNRLPALPGPLSCDCALPGRENLPWPGRIPVPALRSWPSGALLAIAIASVFLPSTLSTLHTPSDSIFSFLSCEFNAVQILAHPFLFPHTHSSHPCDCSSSQPLLVPRTFVVSPTPATRKSGH